MHCVLPHTLAVHGWWCNRRGEAACSYVAACGCVTVCAPPRASPVGGRACCVISAVAKRSGGVTLAATDAPLTSSWSCTTHTLCMAFVTSHRPDQPFGRTTVSPGPKV